MSGRLRAFLILSLLAVAPASAAEKAVTTLDAEQVEARASFIALVKKARRGDPETQWQVGSTYVKLGDFTRALPMLKAAAEADHPRAAVLLAWLHEVGRGATKDLAEAKRWYRLAADQGEADAMAALGRLLLEEKGTKARDAARQLLQQSAEKGDADGQYYLGWLLTERNSTTRRDEAQAHSLFLKAAEQGHVGAQIALATQFLAGSGTRTDKKAARKWLALAEKTADPVAHQMLGQLWESAGDSETDVQGAKRSYRIAADAGNRDAQFALANLLAKSSSQSSQKEAADWFGKAHEGGHKAAANRLGELYRDGKGDLHQPNKARSIFQQAAEKGDVDAMFNLAEMQNNGVGGPAETDKALKWYAKAADEGNEKASDFLSALMNLSSSRSSMALKGFK